MRLAHISDLHWLDLTGTRFTDFLNKRWTGGFNLMTGRAKTHRHEVVIAALDAIRAQHCDHLVVTGDLTNLAFASEFKAVKKILNSYFDDNQMTIVPGNHDYYTRESGKADRFVSCIYPTLPGDIAFSFDRPWPFVRLINDIALIGLCSAQPRPWFVAAGRLGQRQLDDLETVLKHDEVSKRHKVLALHHHIFQVLTSPGERFRHLDDRAELLRICKKFDVDMILHGHNHDFTQLKCGNTILSEAGSCSVFHATHPNRKGKFNLYDFGAKGLERIETWHYDTEKAQFTHWQTVTPAEIPNAPELT
ncbi:MAG: metallophosphoesterase [Proteobacteria bacterium]|nr:metallophosphoesterase [Pseudomonadota bacterium]